MNKEIHPLVGALYIALQEKRAIPHEMTLEEFAKMPIDRDVLEGAMDEAQKLYIQKAEDQMLSALSALSALSRK